MSLVLGIDTGGTYTDAVVVDLKSKEIIKMAKALTTREDLTVGIRDCIDNLDFTDVKNVNVVSLSTTLATNAIVEGRGCEVGLLLIGHEPTGQFPVNHYSVLPGGHNIKGRPQADLDLELTRQAIKKMMGKVDAIAISSYLSVRNPEHEIIVSEMVRELSNLPVVCAHQLTTSLGFHERTVTAVLNARLIPIITELIESVKKVLEEKEIKAYVMTVKGDGCLMSERLAREKPIETILSGPAASIIGAAFLTQNSEALVLDMGGTTTDIAVLKNGVPRINQEGAVVGEWLTRIRAAEIFTYGLGGDSYIQLTKDRRIVAGPQRVWPLCVVAYRYPYLMEELKTSCKKDYDLLFAQASDCFMLLKKPTVDNMTKYEEEAIDILRNGPRSLFSLAQRIEIDPNLLDLQRMVNLGIISRISVTPTDILHAKGTYVQWNRDASNIGVDILASRLAVTREKFIEMASEAIVNDLCLTCLQSLSACEGQNIWLKNNEAAMYFINKALSPKADYLYDSSFKVKMPIVGIGAPARAWLPKMAQKIHASLVIPEYAEVANAVGAATGKIMETIKVLIKPGEDGCGYLIHAPWERKYFELFDRALEYALCEAKKHAALAAEKSGAKDYEMVINHEDVFASNANKENNIYVESRIEVTAVGRPEW